MLRMNADGRVKAGEDFSRAMAGCRMARTTYYKRAARMEAGDGTVHSLRHVADIKETLADISKAKQPPWQRTPNRA